MKKLFFYILFLLLSPLCLHAQDQLGRFSLGVNISYGSEQDLIGFGARAQYGFTEHIRGVAEYKYYLDRRDWSEWQISADVHYLLNASQSLSFYPILGLRLSRWTIDTGRGSGVLEEDRWKRSSSRLGLNLGFGSQVQLRSNLYLQLEPKYEITKDYGQFTGTVGLMLEF